MENNITCITEQPTDNLTFLMLGKFLLKEYISSDLLRILKHIHPKFMSKKPSITSSTFKLLSSKEFTPKNRFCENGTRITTLIDK